MKPFIMYTTLYAFITVLFLCCSNSEKAEEQNNIESDFTYLALGDSYTIGESVSATQNFPYQLQDSLSKDLDKSGNYKIIAKTGWTTTNLLNAIESENPPNNYDLVTLLIGVNNQYQGKPFSLYEAEFPELLNKAIELANGNKDHVIVVSIPDYAFTPFGQKASDPQKISEEIDLYNAFAKQHAEQEGVLFQNITDITRLGLEDPALVASDGLHPSAKAYKLFVDRLIDTAKQVVD